MASIPVNSINTQLRQLASSANFLKLVTDTAGVGSQFETLLSTSLGQFEQEVVSGVQSITTGLGSNGVALLTANLPGLASQIIGDIQSEASDLNTITGGTVDDGFLNLVATSATILGVQTAINAIASPTDKQLQNILTDITPDRLTSFIGDVVNQTLGGLSIQLTSSVGGFQVSFSANLNSITGNPLKDIIVGISTTALNQIESIGVKQEDAPAILQILDKSGVGPAATAVENLGYVEATTEEIETALAKIDTSVNGSVSFSNVEVTSDTPVYDTDSLTNAWSGADTDTVNFIEIASFEELMIEMLKCEREITQVVFFGMEQSSDQNLDAAMIHNIHKEAGMDGIGFHYIIKPNGVIQKGRPLPRRSEILESHEDYSIMVGIPHDGRLGQSAVTAAIWVSRAFYNVWPGGKLLDAHLLDETLDYSTGLDMDALRKINFKKNFGSDLSSLSTAQIIASAQQA